MKPSAKIVFICIFGFLFFLSASIQAYDPDQIARDYLWHKTINLPYEKRPKVGLALSAGGARGFAHVGVIRVLKDSGLPIDCISGTSAGALIGAFYGAGYPLEKLWELAENIEIRLKTKDLLKLTILKVILTNKLASSEEIEELIKQAIGDKSFEDLKIPFSCSAMDIKTGERIIFDSGKVAIAVRASMNLPGIFKPVVYRHRYLVDGGVIDYLPIDSVKSLCCDWTLASVTKGDFSTRSPRSVLSYYLQVIDIRGSLLIENELRKANFAIRPDVGNIGGVDLAQIHLAGESGVRQAYEDLNAAKKSYILFSMKNVLENYF